MIPPTRVAGAPESSRVIEHPEPCVKVRIGTDTLGRPVVALPIACYLAKNIRQEDGHWIWSVIGLSGYGHAHIHGARAYAHRLTYEALVGPIPEGFQIDHLCRVTACCNPAHLEPVTPQENTRRSDTRWAVTHRSELCHNGLHPFTGTGRCPECRQASMARARAASNVRRREARAALKAAGGPDYEAALAAERQEYRRRRARLRSAAGPTDTGTGVVTGKGTAPVPAPTCQETA